MILVSPLQEYFHNKVGINYYNRGKQTRVCIKEDHSMLTVEFFMVYILIMHINETYSFIRFFY